MKKKSCSNDSVSFEELFALADFFNAVANGTQVAETIQTTKEKILQKAGDYLQKGERLASLAKEHFQKVVGKSSISAFEEILYNINPEKGEVLDTICKKVIRPILRQSQVVDGKLCDTALAELLSFLCFDVEITPVKSCVYGFAFRKQLASDTMLKLTLRESGYEDMDVYGLKDHTHPSSKKNVLYKCGDCVADIAKVLTHLVMISVFIKVMSDTESDSYKDALQYYQKGERWTKVDVGCHFLTLRYRCKDGRLKGSDTITEEEYFDQCSDIGGRKWLLPEFQDSEIVYEMLKPFLEEKNVEVERVPLTLREIKKQRFEALEQGFFKTPLDVPIIIEPSVIRYLLVYDPFYFLEVNPQALKYHLFLEKGTTGYWAIPTYGGDLSELIYSVFERECNCKHTQVAALNELKRLATDYARSYQTKKNIPKKTLAAMEESIFNEYFGYVEYDQDVDLEKVKTVEEQFVAFKETYLPDIDSSENAIRFRRLGNHKALGLYYPSVKCLCVDVHSPASLIHEYAHLIDFCYGILSGESDFYQVKRAYEQRLRKKMNEDDAFRKRMLAKGKYNLSYYLLPTEVFARTFELYVKEVLKVNNSLTPDTYGEVYPTDEEFLNLVREYFETTLSILGGLKGQTAA